MLAHDWQNACLPLDTTNDNAVVPLDALVLINRINAFGSGPLPPAGGAAGPPPYYDVTGDDRLTPVDVLAIINAINSGDAVPYFNELGLVRDTAPGGATNTDLITSDGRITGHVTAPLGLTSFVARIDGGPAIPVENQCGDFLFDPGWATDGSDDGPHTVQFDAAYRTVYHTTKSVNFTLDTIAPQLDMQLDPATDTPPLGDGRTEFNPVVLRGQTEPNLEVTLSAPQQTVTADSSGQFDFPNVPVAFGSQSFTAETSDVAGNSATTHTEIDYDCAFPPDLLPWMRE